MSETPINVYKSLRMRSEESTGRSEGRRETSVYRVLLRSIGSSPARSLISPFGLLCLVKLLPERVTLKSL